MLSGASAARDWSQPPSEYQPRARGIDELVADHGGTKGLAQATGRSQRQVQRWVRDGTDRVTPASREALARANATSNDRERRTHGQAEWGELAHRFGGTQGLAQAAGVHRSTAARWLNGKSTPSDANLGSLQRADRRHRLAQTYGHLGVSAQTGCPTGNVHMKAGGQVHARGTGGTPYYDHMRQIGIDSIDARGHELPSEVADDMFTAMGRGDTTGALDALQQHMSGARDDDPWGYANCGAYSVSDDVGFFIDDFTEFNLN